MANITPDPWNSLVILPWAVGRPRQATLCSRALHHPPLKIGMEIVSSRQLRQAQLVGNSLSSGGTRADPPPGLLFSEALTRLHCLFVTSQKWFCRT